MKFIPAFCRSPWFTAALVVIGTVLVLILVCDLIVTFNARGRTSADIADLPSSTRTALLLGTSPVSVRHTRNHSYYNRIDAAARLFKSGQIDRIIASGGDYSARGGFNEPRQMALDLVAAGVPRDSIDLDADGTRTLLSILNVRDKYHLDSVIIISQQYHCERALFQADHVGLEAYGFNAANTPAFIDKARNWGRERLARVKLMIDMALDR